MTVRLYQQSLDGWGNIVWPDGRAFLDQPVKLVRAFNVIRAALERYKKKGS